MMSLPMAGCSMFVQQLPGKLGRQLYRDTRVTVGGTASAEVEEDKCSCCRSGIWATGCRASWDNSRYTAVEWFLAPKLSQDPRSRG